MRTESNKRKLTPDEINEILVREMLEDADGIGPYRVAAAKDTGKVIYLDEYRRKKLENT